MVRKTIAVMAAVVASVGGLALAAPASASDPGGGGSWDHTFVSWDGGATLYVQERGDEFMLCDSKADGMSAKAYIGWIDPVTLAGDGFPLKVGNFGSCIISTASDNDVPEGVGVDVTVSEYSIPLGEDHFYFVNDH